MGVALGEWMGLYKRCEWVGLRRVGVALCECVGGHKESCRDLGE